MKNQKNISLQARNLAGGIWLVLACCLATRSVPAATLSWSGGGATDNWGDSANWGGAGTPANGDTLIFGAIATARVTSSNNISGRALSQVHFRGAGGGFVVYGQPLSVTNSIQATNTAGANTISNTITLATAPVTINVSNNATLAMAGQVAGTVDMVKAGQGTLIYRYTSSNGHNGATRVNAGALQLNVGGSAAFNGPLVIGDGTGLGSPKVQLLQSTEIPSSAPISIDINGVLDLNGFSDTIGASLTLNSGEILTGSGTLTLGDNASLTNSGNSYVFGHLSVGSGGTCTLNGSGLLYFSASLSGAANLVKNGSLNLYLEGDNTFTGWLTANASGILYLASSTALGGTNSGTTLNDGVYLYLYPDVNITNETLTLNTAAAAAIRNITSNTNAWHATNFTLAANAAIRTETNSLLELRGPITGGGGIIKSGPGRLMYAGGTANTYSGATRVNEGTLDLAKGGAPAYAIPAGGAGLFIGDGAGTDVVRNFGNAQIWGSAPVTITNSGIWDINGYADGGDPLALSDGRITTGSGLYAAINTITAGGGSSSTISGNVRLDNASVVFSNTATLNLNAAISGFSPGYGFAKAGGGSLYLAASNTYGGPTVVRGGYLRLLNHWALGGASGGTIVSNGASLVLEGSVCVTNEALTLNGPGASTVWGALDAVSGSHTWAGPITNNANSTLDAWDSGTELHLNGPISGAGGLELFNDGSGMGTHYFEGAAANTYAGMTTVDPACTLVLNKSTVNQTIPGGLNIFGTVRLAAGEQTAQAADVTIQSSGRFETDGHNNYIDALNGGGVVDLGGGGWLVIGANHDSSTYNGVISGLGSLYKFGNGTITLTGTNTYTGNTFINTGTLLVNGYQPQSPVGYYSGTDGILGGTGVVGTIAADGQVAPGASPGILTCGDLTFSGTGHYRVELNGPNAGTGYDQLRVRGTNALGNALLTVTPGFAAPVALGQQFMIITNDGAEAVAGTFNGLANGAVINAGGHFFRINYNGGTGNDVVLTVLGVPDQTLTLASLDRGWYDSSGYHDPANDNYYAGQETVAATNLYRNWFVFNAPLSTGTLVSAELILKDYGVGSPDGEETYVLHQVTNSIATLRAGGSGLKAVYEDLGDGWVYGVRHIFTNEAQEMAIIPLNISFLNDLAAAGGGQIALGGSLASLTATNTHDQYLFWGSFGPPGDAQLRLTYGTSMTLNSISRGWYNNSGQHTAGNYNYFAGVDGGAPFNNYFVFNLPAFSGQLVNAQLLLNSYTIASPDGFEAYKLSEVVTPMGVLTNTTSNATNVYADLADGAVYGGRDLLVSESSLAAGIPLNAGFLAAAQARGGGAIALGGSLTSLSAGATQEYLFGYSSGFPADAQLWLGLTPAPVVTPSFNAGPACLGNNRFQLSLAGTAGTTNEIQATFDYQNWDFIGDVIMTGATTTFQYTNNNPMPYRFFRARQLP